VTDIWPRTLGLSESLSREEAAQRWDPKAVQHIVDQAERQRQEVVARFPLEDWPTLELERYALGTDRSSESYCYALEFGTPVIGSIRGGSSRKHVIYWRRREQEWYFDRKFRNVEEAWDALRAAFVRIFELVEADDFEALADYEPVAWAPALMAKSVYMYFPEKVVPIASFEHLLHFLRLLQADDVIPSSVIGARRVLEAAHGKGTLT
jgi:5-methylcytosine-specific restriction enzyme B